MTELAPPQRPFLDMGPLPSTDETILQLEVFNQRLAAAQGSASETATILTDYLFSTDPAALDVPPHILHRFGQSRAVMASYEGGEALLQRNILEYFKIVGSRLEEGYTYARTWHKRNSNPAVPESEDAHGRLNQRVNLHPAMAETALAWNRWFQRQLEDGKLDDVINGPNWVGMKLAEGAWLPAGNLAVEVLEGVPRVRRPMHLAQGIDERWGLRPDEWTTASHILSKGIMELGYREVGGPYAVGPNDRQLTPLAYARAYRNMLELMNLNPQLEINYLLSQGTWVYSPELLTLDPRPRIARLQEGDILGDVVTLGSAMPKPDGLDIPSQVKSALDHPVLRAAHERGKYDITVVARCIGRIARVQGHRSMRDVVRYFGLEYPQHEE